MSKLLVGSFYVDDFIGGAASVQEGEEIYTISKRIMKEGGFHLRKWHTNITKLQDKMSQECDHKVSSNVRVLGLDWNTDNELYFNLDEVIKYSCNLPPTKRSVLRLSAKIFDPLGFLSLFIVQLKISFQQLCVDKTNWDQPLKEHTLEEWNKLVTDLRTLTKFESHVTVSVLLRKW